MYMYSIISNKSVAKVLEVTIVCQTRDFPSRTGEVVTLQ
jgi:hypothetical protein